MQRVYARLQPPEPTPPHESCGCVDAPPIKLMSALSYNPICCMSCNLEVRPDLLGLSESVVAAIANWRQIHDSLYLLWLDSGEYENWAKAQLLDLSGQVNVAGRKCQASLNGIRKCYYWLFSDNETPDGELMSHCPDCGRRLSAYEHGTFKGQWLTCEDCMLAVG